MNTARRRKWEKRICFILIIGIAFLLLYRGIPEKVANVESGKAKADYYATTAQAKKVISLVAMESELYIVNTETKEFVRAGEEMNDVNKYEMYVKDVLSGTTQNFVDYLKISNYKISNSIKASDKGTVINSSDTANLKEQVYEKDSVYIDTVSELKGNTEDSLSIKLVPLFLCLIKNCSLLRLLVMARLF